MKRLTAACLALLLLPALASMALFGQKKSVRIEYPGKIVDCQGVSSLRPALQERWTPLETGMLLSNGDRLRTDVRGANAFQARIGGQHALIAGPGSLIELVDENTIRIVRGEVELTPAEEGKLTVRLPKDESEAVKTTTIFRATRDAATKLEREPNWLKYFKGTVTHESMGSLVAKVEGRNTPLTIGYHKVTVDVRDQIARTVIEESFVNHTKSRLEGVFSFPLPQDASISGFAMWIGDQMVEADVVEKQRAREIYETILRERRDPGLLEWTGGNIFKARVFPIFANSEKRIKITYTQVLPMDGSRFRYRYALQSEMLRQNPLRELQLDVKIHSQLPLKKVACPSHEAQVSTTKHSAELKFSAQEYTPSRDLEVEVEVDKRKNEVAVIPHRRGEDGYFLLLVNPPAAKKGLPALIGDGPPLDILVVADTSASMDKQQRKLQDEFIAFLLGSLGRKDRFRLLAGDKDAVWFRPKSVIVTESGTDVPPPPVAPTEETVEELRAFLAARVSLGWTDMASILSTVFKAAGENTHIVYVGDCIDTSGDSDPVATSRALGHLHQAAGGKGTVHAVATSSSFEPIILKGLAGLGGGSFRQLEGKTPARTGAMDLIEELTRPGMRNMKVEFKGVRVARVYPEELPNLPAGRQQIVIGRYLPEGKDQQGSVLVSGEYKGKKVEYKAPVILKDAESGNSFIPRLWARMHLDALLDQGRTPEVKADAIALSEEYSIMTPYTSFLVLESDEDRERFAVKRRFRMRDGEKFFAEGRDAANFELRRKQMRLAGLWRKNLRRKMQKELIGLGRRLPQPTYQRGYYGRMAEAPCERVCGADGGWGSRGPAPEGGSYSYRHDSPMSYDLDENGWSDYSEYEVTDRYDLSGDEDLGDYFDAEKSKELELQEPLAAPEPILAMKALADPSPTASRGWVAQEEMCYTARPMICKPPPAPPGAAGGLDFVSLAGNKLRAQSPYRGGYSSYWIDRLFPRPSAPRPQQSTETKWPDNARKLAESLLRQDKLDTMTGGIEVEAVQTTYDTRTERETQQRTVASLYSPGKWTQIITADHQQTFIAWYDGEHRGRFARGYQAGRRRPAVPADRRFVGFALPGCSAGSFRSLAQEYRIWLPEVKDAGNDKTLLVLQHPTDTGYRMKYLIDTRRNVLLRSETHRNGKMTHRTTFSKFVKAADCWWATEVVTVTGEGKRQWTTRLSVRNTGKDAFEKEIGKVLSTIHSRLIINDPLPDFAAAKQAEHDQALAFEHHLVLIASYLGSSRHDEARKQWEIARKLVAGQPGAEWINFEILLMTRRREEARKLILEKAEHLLEHWYIDKLYLAGHLNGLMSRCGQTNERIVLLDKLKPVFERQPARLGTMKTWQTHYADALRQVGRTEESLALRKKLAEEHPEDVALQTRYLSALLNSGRTDDARSRMAELLAKPHRWTTGERDSIRSTCVYQFMNRLPGDEWLKTVEEWIADDTLNSAPYTYYLTALLRVNRLDDCRKVITEWIEAGLRLQAESKKDDPDKAAKRTMVKMQAAVSAALGQGYNMHNNYVDPHWHELLAKTAKAMFASATHGHIANRIMSHHDFGRTDRARTARRYFITVLGKEAGTLTPDRLDWLVNWLSRNDPRVDEEIWTDVARRLEDRWAKEKDANLKNRLGRSLVNILYRHDKEEGHLRFLRKQVKEGPEDFRHAYLANLYNELHTRKWSEDHEAELFALLPRVDAGKDDRFPVEAIVPRLYALVDRLVAGRSAALSAATEKKGKMSRKELAAERKRVLTEAREAMIRRLEKEIGRQEKALHPWLVTERLYLEMQLKKDAKPIVAECWELLPAKPWLTDPAPDGDDKKQMDWYDLHLLDRSMVTLCCLAAKKSSDPALLKRVFDYLDVGLELAAKHAKDAPKDSDPALYWRFQKYRLLVARDEPKQLEKALRAWVTPEKADPTWPLALGYLMAEQNRMPDAIQLFERLEKADSLGSNDLRSLANWYMVVNERAKYKEGLVNALMRIDEYQLSRRLNPYLRPWQEHNVKMPEELDAEVIRIFTALFRKARRPQSYVYRLHDFYRYTRDFRLLQCMAEGMIGHSAQRAYPYVQSLYSVLNEVRDEATADSIVEHLAEVRKRAKTRVDNRALDILELQVRRRAAEVANQPGQHVPAAFAALKRVFAGDWAPGERRLMADLVASLGKINRAELAAEQLRQLEAFRSCRTEPPQDKLFIARRYAETLSLYGKHDQALDTLQSGLEEFRQHSGGMLPSSANTAMDRLTNYYEQRKRFSSGEKWLQREIGRPANHSQRNWLTRRLLRLHVCAIGGKGTTSLGSGQALHGATYKKIVAEFDSYDQGHRRDLINIIRDLFRASHRVKLKPAHLREFAFEVMPRFLEKESDQHSYHSHIYYIGEVLRDILGPLTGLEFLIVRLEEEPEWLRIARWNSGWSRHASHLGLYREQAKKIGALEPRLLALVLRELRRDLTYRRSHSRYLYTPHNHYWSEKESDFLAVAEDVWRKRRSSGHSVAYIAGYVWDLHKYNRAIEMLLDAYTNQRLNESGQSTLVTYLHSQSRHRESVPVLNGLIKRRPDNINYRSLLITAYSQISNVKMLKETVDAADKHFHEGGRWHESNMRVLALACVRPHLYDRAVKYYDELIPLHKRRMGRRTSSHTLSEYYRHLARAHTGLKQTVQAVEAACGAIVVWGSDLSHRGRAINSLSEVLRQAHDLPAYIAHLDKQAEESGLENPIVRKALGRVLLNKNQHKEAIRNLELAVEAQPNDTDTHKALLQAYDRMKDREGAVRQLLVSIELSRRSIELYKDLGERYDRLQNKQQAERAYLSIVEMLPNESESHTMLAEIRQRQNRWDDAIHHWEQVVRVRTLEPTGLLKLAEAQLHQEQWDAALDSIEALEKKGWPPRFGDVHYKARRLRDQIRRKRE